MTWKRVLLWLVLGLQVCDGSATYVGILGGFREGNPLIVWMITHFGLGLGLVLSKLAACGIVLRTWYYGRDSPLAGPVLGLMAGISWFAVMTWLVLLV